MQHNMKTFEGDNYMSQDLVRGPMFGVVPSKEDASLYQAAVYKMDREGHHIIARLSARRVSYGEAYCEAAKMAGIPGYA